MNSPNNLSKPGKIILSPRPQPISNQRTQANRNSAFVTIGDLNEEAGSQFASELGKYAGDPTLHWLKHYLICQRSAQFINCDTTKWEDQISLFKAAVSKSPNQSCDIVLANAGISAEDDLISFEGSQTITI